MRCRASSARSIITGIAALISIPIGILTAIYLVEYAQRRNWMSRTVTFLVDVMTGIPSIVAGLFAFALFSLHRRTEGVQRLLRLGRALGAHDPDRGALQRRDAQARVSMELREASYALGVSKFATITKIVLPTAIAGLVTGVMLAIARVIGETAPIFIAASFTDNLNTNAFFGPMSTLAGHGATRGYKFPSTDIRPRSTRPGVRRCC